MVPTRTRQSIPRQARDSGSAFQISSSLSKRQIPIPMETVSELVVTERGRFELPRQFPACRFSKPVPSTTQPPLHYCKMSLLLSIADGGLVLASSASLRMKREAVHVSSREPPLHYCKYTTKLTIFCVSSKKWYSVAHKNGDGRF